MQGAKIVYQFGESGLLITETVFLSLLVLLFVTAVCYWLTRNLAKVPSTKRQLVAEIIVSSVNNMIKTTMGQRYVKGYAPYIAAIMAYSFMGSSLSLFGLRPLTIDLNVTLSWGLMTFILMQANRFKSYGFTGYFKNLASPIAFMMPLNMLSEMIIPVSLAFRHFGNILGGSVIMSLVRDGLNSLNNSLGIPFPLVQIGIPAALSAYLDVFAGFLQAYIFATLTMVFISNRGKEELV